MQPLATSPQSNARGHGWPFAAGLLAVVACVLALPVFPSGDGPVHIYLARVLFLLASHQGGVYTGVYSIRHLIQPYSLHYFWLIGCGQIVSTAWAEKSFVVAILLVNACGFRFLARQLGSPAVSLWILPLLLSWALGSGFLNFCFAAGMLFFAYGLYLRVSARPQAGAVAGYSAALFLLVLSHPVPLLVLLLLLAADIALLAAGRLRTGTGGSLRSLAPQWTCLALACIAFVFPMLIADKASVADSLLRDLRPHAAQLRAIASGDRLSLFFSGSVAGLLFTAALVALAPAGVFLLARGGAVARFRAGHSSAADRLCAAALLLLLATIVFPQSMNGSALFADRMVPVLWPFLFVGVAAVPLSRGAWQWSTGAALLATATSVVFALLYLLPAARQQQALTQAPLPHDARGLFITAPAVRRPFRAHLAAELLGWGGARAFAAHNDVLLNNPWMQLTIVPVRENGAAGLLRDRLPGSLSESPVALGKLLQLRSADAEQALAGADFLLYSDPAASPAATAQAVLSYLPQNPRHWQCTVYGFYAVCLRKNAAR